MEVKDKGGMWQHANGAPKSKGRHDVPYEKSSTCQTLVGLRSLVLLLPRFSLVRSAGASVCRLGSDKRAGLSFSRLLDPFSHLLRSVKRRHFVTVHVSQKVQMSIIIILILNMVQPGFFLNFPIFSYQILCKTFSKISQSSTRKEKTSQKFPSFCPKKKPKKYLQKNKGYKPHRCKLLSLTVRPKLAIFGKRNFLVLHIKNYSQCGSQ